MHHGLPAAGRGYLGLPRRSVKMGVMSSPLRPPARPRARGMLDASTKQTVTAASPSSSPRATSGTKPNNVRDSRVGAGRPGASVSSTARAEESHRRDAARVPTASGTRGSTVSSSPRRTATPVAGVEAPRGSRFGRFRARPGDDTKASSATRPKGADARASRPDTHRPGVGSKSSHRPLRIHSKRESLKWSFGGLTVSVRMLVTLAIAGMVAVTLVPLGLQWIKQEQAYRSIVAEVSTAQERAADLQDELAGWDDEDFVAAAARERLGYVRPGETQYVVTDAPPAEVGEPEEDHNNLTGPAKPWMWGLAESLKDVDTPPASTGLAEATAPEAQQETVGETTTPEE